MSSGPRLRLERAIRLPQAVALVAGTIIGVAIFVQPAEVARRVGSPTELLLVWLAAALLALAGALICAELSSSFREGGGVYRYLTAAYGPATGFLWSWALFWTIHTSIIAAVAVVFARSVRTLVPALPLADRPVAVLTIVAITLLNGAGVRRGAGLQTALAAVKVTALLALAAAGLWLGSAAASPPASAVAEPPDPSFGAALIAALFTFGGWHLVTFPTSETAAPRRTLPRAIVLGFAAVTAVYAALNLAYLRVLPLGAIAASSHVAADAAAAVAGAGGRVAVASVATVSALGALAGLILVGPRIYFAAARDGLAPDWLGALHGRFRTPHLALAAQAVWASVLAMLDSYRGLYGRALVVEWSFFALLAGAAVILRRRGLGRRFSAPAHPLLPIAFSAVAVALVADRVAADPVAAALGLAPVAAGLPVYFWLRGRRDPAPAPAPLGSES